MVTEKAAYYAIISGKNAKGLCVVQRLVKTEADAINTVRHFIERGLNEIIVKKPNN